MTVASPGQPPRTHVLKPGAIYTLGRGREASIRLDDDKVSRRHVNVTLTPSGVEIEDLGSRNGSLVDGKLLTNREVRRVTRRAFLEVGDARIHIELEAADASPRTARIENALPDLSEEFEVLGEIGHGASGRVYVARDRRLGRTVAVKALKPQFAAGSRESERFLREGKLASRVKSVHVIEILDVRMHGDHTYIVMELVQGPSAKERLAAGPLPLPAALSIGEDIARALAAAKDAGVVHRDVKPGNILIDADGVAKLGDFGIAKDTDHGTVHALTGEGDGLGTLAYVSPEQATDARMVDHRTDIYGLGATLYHLIAGRPPFLPTSAKVLLDILDKPVPPLVAFRIDVPPEVAALVEQMLAKSRDDRPQSAHEVAVRIREMRLSFGLIRSAGADATADLNSRTDEIKLLRRKSSDKDTG
jgi:serine/threonine protein kinase